MPRNKNWRVSNARRAMWVNLKEKRSAVTKQPSLGSGCKQEPVPHPVLEQMPSTVIVQAQSPTIMQAQSTEVLQNENCQAAQKNESCQTPLHSDNRYRKFQNKQFLKSLLDANDQMLFDENGYSEYLGLDIPEEDEDVASVIQSESLHYESTCEDMQPPSNSMSSFSGDTRLMVDLKPVKNTSQIHGYKTRSCNFEENGTANSTINIEEAKLRNSKVKAQLRQKLVKNQAELQKLKENGTASSTRTIDEAKLRLIKVKKQVRQKVMKNRSTVQKLAENQTANSTRTIEEAMFNDIKVKKQLHQKVKKQAEVQKLTEELEPPSNIIASFTNETRLIVKWKPVENTSQIDGYKVLISRNGEAWNPIKFTDRTKFLCILKMHLFEGRYQIGVCSYKGCKDSEVIEGKSALKMTRKKPVERSEEMFSSKGYILKNNSNSKYLNNVPGCMRGIICPWVNVTMKPLLYHKVLSIPIKPTALLAKGQDELFQTGVGTVFCIENMNYCFCLDKNLVDHILKSKDESFGSYGVQVFVRFCLYENSVIHQDIIPECIVRVNGERALLHLKNKDLGGPLDITKMCAFTEGKDSEDILSIEWLPSAKRIYYVTVCVAEKLDIADVVSKWMVENVKDPSFTRQMVQEKLKADKYVSCTSLKTSLTCPLGKTRIVSPCRGQNCVHIQCVDAVTLLKLNEGRPLSGEKCYVCDKPVGSIYIDGLILEILTSVPDFIDEIEFKFDGSWTYEGKVDSPTLDMRCQEEEPLLDADLTLPQYEDDTVDEEVVVSDSDEVEEQTFLDVIKSRLSKIQSQVDQLDLLSKRHEKINLKPVNSAETFSINNDTNDIAIDLSENDVKRPANCTTDKKPVCRTETFSIDNETDDIVIDLSEDEVRRPSNCTTDKRSTKASTYSSYPHKVVYKPPQKGPGQDFVTKERLLENEIEKMLQEVKKSEKDRKETKSHEIALPNGVAVVVGSCGRGGSQIANLLVGSEFRKISNKTRVTRKIDTQNSDGNDKMKDIASYKGSLPEEKWESDQDGESEDDIIEIDIDSGDHDMELGNSKDQLPEDDIVEIDIDSGNHDMELGNSKDQLPEDDIVEIDIDSGDHDMEIGNNTHQLLELKTDDGNDAVVEFNSRQNEMEMMKDYYHGYQLFKSDGTEVTATHSSHSGICLPVFPSESGTECKKSHRKDKPATAKSLLGIVSTDDDDNDGDDDKDSKLKLKIGNSAQKHAENIVLGRSVHELAPSENSDRPGAHRRRKRRQRQKVDKETELPQEYFPRRSFCYKNIKKRGTDLAPSTKKLMKMAELGINRQVVKKINRKGRFLYDEELFRNPSGPIHSKELVKLFRRNVPSCLLETTEKSYSNDGFTPQNSIIINSDLDTDIEEQVIDTDSNVQYDEPDIESDIEISDENSSDFHTQYTAMETNSDTEQPYSDDYDDKVHGPVHYESNQTDDENPWFEEKTLPINEDGLEEKTLPVNKDRLIEKSLPINEDKVGEKKCPQFSPSSAQFGENCQNDETCTNHAVKWHPGMKSFVCVHSNQSFNHKNNLVRPMNCDLCGKKNLDCFSYMIHEGFHASDQGITVTCNLCKKMNESNKLLHLKEKVGREVGNSFTEHCDDGQTQIKLTESSIVSPLKVKTKRPVHTHTEPDLKSEDVEEQLSSDVATASEEESRPATQAILLQNSQYATQILENAGAASNIHIPAAAAAGDGATTSAQQEEQQQQRHQQNPKAQNTAMLLSNIQQSRGMQHSVIRRVKLTKAVNNSSSLQHQEQVQQEQLQQPQILLSSAKNEPETIEITSANAISAIQLHQIATSKPGSNSRKSKTFAGQKQFPVKELLIRKLKLTDSSFCPSNTSAGQKHLPINETVNRKNKKEVQKHLPINETVNRKNKKEVQKHLPINETENRKNKKEVQKHLPINETVNRKNKKEVQKHLPITETVNRNNKKEVQKHLPINETENRKKVLVTKQERRRTRSSVPTCDSLCLKASVCLKRKKELDIEDNKMYA